jgi:hypothetical protein
MPQQHELRSFGSADETLEPKLIGTVTVYDRGTGRIVHTHQFLHLGKGEPPSKASMEQQALKAARLPGGDRRDLTVMHQGDVPLKADAPYLVPRTPTALSSSPKPPHKSR